MEPSEEDTTRQPTDSPYDFEEQKKQPGTSHKKQSPSADSY